MCQLCAALALMLFGGPPDEIATLIEQLGSPDFRARESAVKQLDALGVPALKALQAAEAKTDPEVARRAAALVKTITKRADNDRTLAPRFVELSAENVSLSEVFTRLEMRFGYKLAVADPALLRKSVTVKTAGKVPFWVAVQQVCDAADLSVDTSSDVQRRVREIQRLTKPRPPGTRASGLRPQIVPPDAILLQPRSGPLNPSCISGSVRVEAVPFPAAARATVPFNAIPVVLQVTPEPRLHWVRVESVRVTKAVDDAGRNLAALTTATDVVTLPRVTPIRGGVIVVNGRGGVNLVPNAVTTRAGFTGTPAQAFVRLKVADGPSKRLREFAGVIRGVVRSAPEEIATLAGLDANPAETDSHGVGLKVSGITKSGDEYAMDVAVSYNQTQVQPANSDGAGMTGTVVMRNGGRVIVRQQAGVMIANGLRINSARPSAAMLYGLSVADAEGKAFNLRLTRHSTAVNSGGDIVHRMTLVARPSESGQGKPAKLSFHGTRTKHVEVPFKLTDVPVLAGTGPM